MAGCRDGGGVDVGRLGGVVGEVVGSLVGGKLQDVVAAWQDKESKSWQKGELVLYC